MSEKTRMWQNLICLNVPTSSSCCRIAFSTTCKLICGQNQHKWTFTQLNPVQSPYLHLTWSKQLQCILYIRLWKIICSLNMILLIQLCTFRLIWCLSRWAAQILNNAEYGILSVNYFLLVLSKSSIQVWAKSARGHFF